MSTRRAIFYGIPEAVVRALVSEYDVQSVLAMSKLEPMKEVLRAGDCYDVVVANANADKTDLLARAIKVHSRVQFVGVSCKGSADSIVQAIVRAARWSMTTFVVVTSTKGGVGKSTIVGALALSLAHPPKDRGKGKGDEKRVLVVDDNPNQANVSHLLTDQAVAYMPISEMNQPADYLPRRIMRIDDHLSLLTPDEYNSQGGVTYRAAKLFWDTVISLGYDYVVVDTMPSFGAPDKPDEWTDVSLTFALIAGPFRAIYVIPFTPDPWGHEGLTKTRDLLVRENRQQLALPVVVCNDAGSVAENIPPWLQNDSWRDRLLVVPYNHRIRGNPKTLKLRATLFHDALKMYQPVTRKVIEMAKQAGVGG